jgi:plastocyanin
VLIEPGENMTYAEIWFNLLSSAQNVPQGTAQVNLTVTAPSGISITLPTNPVSIVISNQLIQNYVYYTVATNASIAPGQYHVSGVATYGSLTDNFGFTITVVQYLITISNDYFSPHVLTVPVGATVWWINIDPTMGDQETHDVNGGGQMHSPPLQPNPNYDSWSFTFTTAGTYNYSDDYTPKLNASVVVTG